MSLELFELKRDRAGKLLLDINSKQYQDLADVFELFRTKTGILIDECTDTKLRSEISFLIEVVKNIISSTKGNLQIYKDLLCVLQMAESENKNVIFLGDTCC